MLPNIFFIEMCHTRACSGPNVCAILASLAPSGPRGAPGVGRRRKARRRATHRRHHQRLQHGKHRRAEPSPRDHLPPGGDCGPGPHSNAAALRLQRGGGAHQDHAGILGWGPQDRGRRDHCAVREHLEGLLGKPVEYARAPQVEGVRMALFLNRCLAKCPGAFASFGEVVFTSR